MVKDKTSSDSIAARYQKNFKKYGENYRALHWLNSQAAEVRYKNIIQDINFEGKSILDVGSGFSDILKYIKAKDVNYMGVDLVPEFIKISKRRHPQYKFKVLDYFKNPLTRKFDIVILSGALNSNIKNAVNYRKNAIKTMFDHTKESLAFNMAGGHPQPRNKKGNSVYYADSLVILKYCLTLTSKIIFRHHYRKIDFTIIMYK